MRNPGTTTLEVWAPPSGEPEYDPDTGTLTYPPPTLVERVRGHFGFLGAEEKFQRAEGNVEYAEAFALVPLRSKVTAEHYVDVIGHRTIAGEWKVAGVEWQRHHLRLLLKRPTR